MGTDSAAAFPGTSDCMPAAQKSAYHKVFGGIATGEGPGRPYKISAMDIAPGSSISTRGSPGVEADNTTVTSHTAHVVGVTAVLCPVLECTAAMILEYTASSLRITSKPIHTGLVAETAEVFHCGP